MTFMMHDDILNVVWQFVRRDMTVPDFEQWVHRSDRLEQTVGSAFYLDLISTDYRDPDAVYRLREALERFARTAAKMDCECVALSDLAVVEMGNPGRALEHFEQLKRRGEPYWWLSLSRCTACRTPWLVAQEERHNDIFILRRLTEAECARILQDNIWPPDLDRFETLLRIGKDAGHQAIFIDPIGDSPHGWTMNDLARERPGIRLSEIAPLLNIDVETARVIAREVIAKGADIVVDA